MTENVDAIIMNYAKKLKYIMDNEDRNYRLVEFKLLVKEVESEFEDSWVDYPMTYILEEYRGLERK